MEEIEVKFLDVDPEEIRRKLKKLGAKMVFKKLFKRKAFDHPDYRLDKNGAWVRLRDEGDQITFAFKQRLGMKKGKNDTGMEEIQTTVGDFEKASLIMKRLGLVEKHYVENRREHWEYDGVEFDIDEYPLIKPYLEIEAKSWDKIDQAIKWLYLDPKEKKIFSANQVYRLAGLEVDDFAVLTFVEQKKKKT